MTTFAVAADALTSDAHLWTEVSKVLTHQSHNAQSMVLEADALPASSPGVSVAYSQVQAKIDELLRDGGFEAAAISAELLWVRDKFTSTDETVRDSIRGLWNPRGN